MGRARRPGRRSLELLRWVERLEVAGLEPLALAHRLSLRTTYSHVERLRAAGLVERLSERQGTLVAITGPGRREVRPEALDRRGARPSLSSGILVNHALATSWAAALVTLRGLEWASDREMRGLPEWRVPVLEPSIRRTHRPDLGYVVDSGRVAVEVELTSKSTSRLRAIHYAYEHQLAVGLLESVVYVVDHPAVRRSVIRSAQSVCLSGHRFRVVDFAKLRDDVHELARSEQRIAEAA